MYKRKISFVIRVDAPSCTVPYTFFCLAEKNELALSANRRLCAIFFKNMARFDTEQEAKEFLLSVKQKPDWEYSIDQVWESL
jgi:hypothetical protein